MINNLITFGDSWVWGVGAGYQKGQILHQYKLISHDEQYTKLSFRHLICKNFNLQNKNFSAGGASNQQQFRLASEYFLKTNILSLRDKNNHKTNKFCKENLVIWGLTSVYRHEIWNKKLASFSNVFLPSDIEYAKNYAVNHFVEHIEMDKLYYQIELFNSFFKLSGIKNYWFNVFNDHKFPKKIDNMLFDGKSLLSLITDDYEENNKYHKSDWNDTDRKIQKACDMDLVNPHSFHPTKQGHNEIFKIFKKQLNFHTGKKIG